MKYSCDSCCDECKAGTSCVSKSLSTSKVNFKKSKKIKIIVFAGSPRSKETCPGEDGKTLSLAKHAVFDLDAVVEVIDLSVKGDDVTIQPCKGCISTAGGYHCHMPCSCYGPVSNSPHLKDLMYEQNIYKKLEEADGFAVFTPVNWYGPSTQIKAMFDRLVCTNLTLSAKFALKVFDGVKGRKDPRKTVPAGKSGKYDDKLKNWLEGKIAAFYIHGDGGADDYKRCKKPSEYKNTSKFAEVGEENDTRLAIRPLVMQCRYSGIDVPDELVHYGWMNPGLFYAENNEKFKINNPDEKEAAKDLIKRLIDRIKERRDLKKGKKLARRMKLYGMDISIETDKGQERHWYDPNSGESGSVKMKHPYGYIRRTEGADDEHVDVYVGPNEESTRVFVIRQMKKPEFKEYDEDKVMIGFNSPDEAKQAYLIHYNSPKFFGSMKEMNINDFKDKFVKSINSLNVKQIPQIIDIETYEGVVQLLHRIGSMTDEELIKVSQCIWGEGFQYQYMTSQQLREEVIGFLQDQRDLLYPLDVQQRQISSDNGPLAWSVLR